VPCKPAVNAVALRVAAQGGAAGRDSKGLSFGERGAQRLDAGAARRSCPEEQAVIREVLSLGRQGLTLRAVCSRLASLGLRPRSGAWHRQKVQRILERSLVNACGDAATLRA
jgi:hypothetical protein